MFGRKKDGDDKSVSKPEVEATPISAESEKVEQLPPLKPFTRKGTHNPTIKTPSAPAAYRSDLPPRRVLDIPGANRRVDVRRNVESDANTLTVGAEIQVKGEITSCRTLVVKGRVDCTINDAQVLDIEAGGVFTGTAHVDEAFIAGDFDGDLVAFKTLTVRNGGIVRGKVRYGGIVIEEGGRISGEMNALSSDEIAEIKEQSTQ